MATNKKKLLLSTSLAPAARALLDDRDDIEQVYFPHMLPNDEFLALVKKEAPVNGWTLGATRISPKSSTRAPRTSRSPPASASAMTPIDVPEHTGAASPS